MPRRDRTARGLWPNIVVGVGYLVATVLALLTRQRDYRPRAVVMPVTELAKLDDVATPPD